MQDILWDINDFCMAAVLLKLINLTMLSCCRLLGVLKDLGSFNLTFLLFSGQLLI